MKEVIRVHYDNDIDSDRSGWGSTEKAFRRSVHYLGKSGDEYV